MSNTEQMVSVPRVPTIEMIEALAGVISDMFGIDDCEDGFRAAYANMIENLPVQPVAQNHGEVDRLRYKAELYDEVWELATGLGYMNATTAISKLRAQLAERDSLLREVLDGNHLTPGWNQRMKVALSASAEPTTAKQETHDEMRIRHKREFDALDGSGFHYQECRCGTRGSYPVEVKHCVCGKPFDSAEPSAPKRETCKSCHGEGVIHTGVEESPTTLCNRCDGSGNEPSAPVEIDEDEEMAAFQRAGWSKNETAAWLGWKTRAALSGSAEPSAPVEPCKHEWSDDGGFLLVCTACGAQEDHDPHWRDMASAPRDGTMLRLLVAFEEHPTEDADEAPTIGSNNFDNDGEDRWQFAGWCWTHDHFTDGKGEPVGWLPMIDWSVIYGAPVERDERAAFEVAWSLRREELKIKERGNEFYRVNPNDLYRWHNVQDAWEMWQARAALERKP